MTSTEDSIKHSYKTNFKAVDYCDYLTKSYDECPEMLHFIMKFLHDVFHSGRFKGSSLLEIGCGAVVHNIATASAFFPNIVMSDYVEDICKELKYWLQGKSSIKQLLDIPAELEGYSGNIETGKQIIEDRIKKSVKQVIRCDVLSNDLFLENLNPDISTPFDVIISIFCLECTVTNYENYLQIFKRIKKILRPGGGLILCGCFGGKDWEVKDIKYHYFQIGEEDLMTALKEAGFGNIELKTQEKLEICYEYENMYCITAQKLHEIRIEDKKEKSDSPLSARKN